MPVYQYQGKDGTVIELVRPIAGRDSGIPRGFKRITVPRSLDVVGGRVDPTSADGQVPNGFKQLEATMPASRIARETGFSVDHIKRVWGM